MAKIKKYYPGVSGLTSNTGAITDSNAFSTGKFLFPQQKTLGNIVDNKVMSKDYLDKAKPSFMDKAKDFMKGGDIGGMASSLGGSLAMIINANKKQDPTGKPYKIGTKKLNTDMKKKKYDEGSDSLLNTAGPRMTNTSGENFGYSLNTNSAKKTTVKQKPAMNAEMQKVARLQQKMKAAGYNIKVDGKWGSQTQKAFESYNPTGGSLPSNTRENKFTFNAGDKGKGTDVTAIQDRYVKPMQMPANRNSSTKAAADNTRVAGRKTPSLQSQRGSSYTGVLPSNNKSNRFTFNTGDRGQGQDFTTAQDNALKQNKLVGTGEKISSNGRINFFKNGTEKVSGYSKLDTKLGGILPGGVTKAEAKAAKNSKNATSEGKFGPMAGGYAGATKATTGVGPLAGGYSKPAPDLSKPVGPMTDIRKYTNADNMPASSSTPAASTKKSLKTQYEENKGGYARALKGGKKDAQGNIVDPNTGLAYKQLPAKTGGTGGSGKSGVKENSLFKNGVAIKNFKDARTGINYYTNGRAFDEKTGRMAKYAHNPKSNKIGLQFDKAKAVPVKKRKGDDTYMDEIIDTGSRIVGSIGGGLLAGGATFGVGSVAGAVAGDYAGKRFGNYLNKKLGYREEDDASQEGYSLEEAALASAGGAAGKLIKFAAPVVGKVGGAIVSRGGKELAKVSGAPLGKVVAATGRAAGKLIGKEGSKAAAQTTNNAASQGAAQAASQSVKQSTKLVNSSGAISKVAPTAQSSRAAGNLGKIPTKAVKGEKGRFTKNPANTPAKTSSKLNPDNVRSSFKKGEMPIIKTSATSSPATASTQGFAMGPAKANLKQSASNAARTAGRKTKEAGKRTINFAKNNKKTTASIGVGGASLLGGGYALSKTKTSGK